MTRKRGEGGEGEIFNVVYASKIKTPNGSSDVF
jgi:hypothetical protein